jgi:superfamily I DNA and RNA helicase
MLVLGQDDIKNEAHAAAASAVIRTFGDSPAGFIYMEPCTARSTRRPPDIVLCHPDFGLVVFEVKGYSSVNIESVNAGSLFVRHQGQIRQISAFRQAEQAMYDIKHQCERASGSGALQPAFNAVVVLPNVTQREWIDRSFSACFPEQALLLKDDLEPDRLKAKIKKLLAGHQGRPLTPQQIHTVKAVFGDSATINSTREARPNVAESSLGGVIDEMAVMDKYLSAEQTELSRLAIGGFPRLIRGVAGSGKTIVLANLVARLLNREKNTNPSLFDDFENGHLKIAVICFNRALVSFLRQKIKDAYKQQTFEDVPSGDILWVGHLNSLMRKITYGRSPELQYIPVDNAKDAARQRAIQYNNQFQSFIQKHTTEENGFLYDAIFIDEGQDFEPEEFQSLLSLLKPDKKTGEKSLIIFYDDAQNLYARERPVWKQIGIDVQRGDRAKVMKECFRNTRQIVETAFNLLLGSEATSEDKVSLKTYADVGYLREAGLIEEVGSFYKVGFADRTSNYPSTHVFPNRTQEKEWIAAEVERLIKQEAVRPEDVLILFSYGEVFEDLGDLIRKRLGPEHIRDFCRPYGKHADRDAYIFKDKCLTLSTVHGAKGYDAYVVFLVGVDMFRSDEAGRASLYVGATRAKLKLYFTGLKSRLLTEAERAITHAQGLRP